MDALFEYPYIYALEDDATNINQVTTRGIVVTSHGGVITISGLDTGENVHFYTVDGKLIGSARAIDGIVSQTVSSSSLVIAKIGSLSLKIVVK